MADEKIQPSKTESKAAEIVTENNNNTDDDDDDDDLIDEDDDYITESDDDQRGGRQLGRGGGDFSVSETLDVLPITQVPMEFVRRESSDTKVGHQKPLASVAAQVTPRRLKIRFKGAGFPPSSSELLPSSVTQSIPSAPSSTPKKQKLSPVMNNPSAHSPTLKKQKLTPVVNSTSIGGEVVVMQPSACIPKMVSSPPMKTSFTDIYNWRKYGEKQVKTPQGSRSYFKCTYNECHAKKMEFSNFSSHLKEITYKGQHNHDPPRKENSAEEAKVELSDVPVVWVENMTPPGQALTNSDQPSPQKVSEQEPPAGPDLKQPNLNCSDGSSHVIILEHSGEPRVKRRYKPRISKKPVSPKKTPKKPKFVVHDDNDVGLSGDGYKWRKYGQKMVKGNPHPRNYYKCTSDGCPVRKHIEVSVDSPSGFIVMYKGVHDHGMPKKDQDPPNGHLSPPPETAISPVACNNLQSEKTEASRDQVPAVKEGELAG